MVEVVRGEYYGRGENVVAGNEATNRTLAGRGRGRGPSRGQVNKSFTPVILYY